MIFDFYKLMNNERAGEYTGIWTFRGLSFFSSGAQHLLEPEKPLENIDFTNLGEGLYTPFNKSLFLCV